MTMPDIHALLPHSGAMVLLDRVLSADEENLCAEVTIRAASMFCGADGVGGWVGIEYMAQAIAAHAGYAARMRGEAVKIGFLLGSRRYTCTWPAFAIGSVLRIAVHKLLQAENGLASFDCRIKAGDDDIATASITVFQPHDAATFFKDSAR
jgi:predicted hotdog family 3-hydroxylacyl-ACP dehydratase